MIINLSVEMQLIIKGIMLFGIFFCLGAALALHEKAKIEGNSDE